MRTVSRSRRLRPGRVSARAFTLFETLIVLALMAIIVSIGMPSFLYAVRKSPLRQAMSDLEEACHGARLMAILSGAPSELVIRAADGTLTVRRVQETAPENGEPLVPSPTDGDPHGEAVAPTGVAPSLFKLPETVAFKTLVVNLEDMMDSAEARVRFYPNSTCDAFSASLLSEDNEERVITLEVTTAREYIEVVR